MGVNASNPPGGTSAPTPPIALTVAGTDSGGSAGLAADLRSFAANGVHGVFAVTVVTAQNSTGIASFELLPTRMVEAQLDALTADFAIRATKTGLLFSAAAIDAVAERVAKLGPLVVDPVLVSSSGEALFGSDVVDAYVERLFPAAQIITPNVAEASLLSGRPIDDRDSAVDAALELLELGPGAVLVTGLLAGHAAIDVLATAEGTTVLEHELIDTNNVLGTGCSLSAALAARLAHGDTLEQAVDTARGYVLDGLRGSAEWQLGAGHGPIDHMARWPGLR